MMLISTAIGKNGHFYCGALPKWTHEKPEIFLVNPKKNLSYLSTKRASENITLWINDNFPQKAHSKNPSTFDDTAQILSYFLKVT